MMKRRILYYDKRAVSNIVAYFFSFSIASMVMVSSVLITNGIIEDKTAQIASLQAQSVANKIAYGILEAIVSRQSNSGSNYTKTLDVPLDLAGLDYYIEISDAAVYVNTTNGRVSRSCETYNAEELNIGISSGRLYCGGGKINIYHEKPEYMYKFDFGKGNSTSHSPVESGYYMITEKSNGTGEPAWHVNDYLYRIPINVSNPSSENLTNVPVRIVLNTGNFDYSHANVYPTSSSEVKSDIVFCNDTYPTGDIPYYIDHWNPNGESVILVNMTLKNYSYEHIYLYYGYTGSLEDKHKHNIGNVSMFFDEFNADLSQWDAGGVASPSGGNVTLGDGQRIITQNFIIPPIKTPGLISGSINVSEAMYIVEAKMKIENGEGDMILLSQSSSDYGDSYLFLTDRIPTNSLSLQKIDSGSDQELQKVIISDLNPWLRVKSYVYLSDTCYPSGSHTSATLINGYLYNFTTFACRGNISGIDSWYYNGQSGDPDDDDATGEPYLNGSIGIGCGLLGSETSNVIVDWIRVMKTPINPPTVSVGPIESKKYKWTVGTVNADNSYNISNPFDPGPVMSDFNYGTSATFTIESLPGGDYTITVTMGKYNDTCNETTIQFGGDTLTIPATENGEFETKWRSINWLGGNLGLEFSSTGSYTWTVNSIVIERGEKGIKITEG